MAKAVAAALLACALPGMPRARATTSAPPLLEYRSITTLGDPADTASPLDILSASFGQVGEDAFLALRTRRPWQPRQIGSSRRSLCVHLFPRTARKPATGRLCVGHAPGSNTPVLGYQGLGRDGAPARALTLDAQLFRRDDYSIEARFPLAQAALEPGLRRWQAISVWAGTNRCRRTEKRPQGCVDTAPNTAPTRIRFVRVRLAGCEPARAGLPEPILSGPLGSKAVALTFDDGPGASTPAILHVLEHDKVPATFFMLGDQVGARAGLVRRMLLNGDMVGNHSWNHANLAPDGPAAERQLKQTNAAIERASGFSPCLFRAPYGASSPALLEQVKSLGMSSIEWNVDPRDWTMPGATAIERRVLRAVRPGSIVLMHDGGGDRSQTAAALPTIIATLRARGYAFKTVTDLIGVRSIFVR